jgi:hypothetical protein
VQALAVHRHPDEAHVGTPVVQDGALLVGLDQERVELVAPPLAPAVEPLVRHHARHEGNTERLLVHPHQPTMWRLAAHRHNGGASVLHCPAGVVP